MRPRAHFQSATTKRSSNCVANWALAACYEIGGFFQCAWTLRSTSQMSLVAASSLGKWPRILTALRTWALRLSIALVMYRIFLTSGANAKNGMTCSQLRRRGARAAGGFRSAEGGDTRLAVR